MPANGISSEHKKKYIQIQQALRYYCQSSNLVNTGLRWFGITEKLDDYSEAHGGHTCTLVGEGERKAA